MLTKLEIKEDTVLTQINNKIDDWPTITTRAKILLRIWFRLDQVSQRIYAETKTQLRGSL